MLQNEHLLVKVGTAEDGPRKVRKTGPLEKKAPMVTRFSCRSPTAESTTGTRTTATSGTWTTGSAPTSAAYEEPSSLLGRANFTGLVLGCIEAKYCKKICVWKLSPRSTQCTPLHWSKITFLKFSENVRKILAIFWKMWFQSCAKQCIV